MNMVAHIDMIIIMTVGYYACKNCFILVNDSHVTFHDHLVHNNHCITPHATKYFTIQHKSSSITHLKNRVATALSIPPAHSLEMNSLLAVLMQRHFRTSRTSLMGVQKSS